jgi:hypothetical protein
MLHHNRGLRLALLGRPTLAPLELFSYDLPWLAESPLFLVFLVALVLSPFFRYLVVCLALWFLFLVLSFFPNPKSVIMFRIVSSAVVWCIITVNQCHPGLGIRRLRYRGLVLAALRCLVSDYRLSTRIARPRRYLQEQGQQQEQGARATWELIPVVENAPPYGLCDCLLTAPPMWRQPVRLAAVLL